MAMKIDNTKYLDESFIEEKKEEFKRLLLSAEREGMHDLLDFLENKTDFFTAPASTMYHNNFDSGLLVHSLNVLKCFTLMYKQFNLTVNKKSLIITTLLHDICKCNLYTKEGKWFKPDNKTWVEYTGYKFDDSFPMGHGEKSVAMAQRFIQLTAEEMLMIRWHMGAFTENADLRALSKAQQLSTAVSALNIADLQASNFFEPIIDLKKLPDTDYFNRMHIETKVEKLLEF